MIQVFCCTCHKLFGLVFFRCPGCEYESESAAADRLAKLEEIAAAAQKLVDDLRKQIDLGEEIVIEEGWTGRIEGLDYAVRDLAAVERADRAACALPRT